MFSNVKSVSIDGKTVKSIVTTEGGGVLYSAETITTATLTITIIPTRTRVSVSDSNGITIMGDKVSGGYIYKDIPVGEYTLKWVNYNNAPPTDESSVINLEKDMTFTVL